MSGALRSAAAPDGAGSAFHLIAHRGGAGHAPENTRPACAWALANGIGKIRYIEQRKLYLVRPSISSFTKSN